MSETDPTLGPCGWCGEPSVTEVIVVRGRKRKKKVGVCEEHAARFEHQGQMTTRMESSQRMERERQRNQWKRSRTWR